MKRFIAYILLSVSILLGSLAGFVPTLLSINASADYDNGQNFIYQITTKTDSTKNDGDIQSGDALLTVSDIFKTRLDAANISTYKLETEGTDTIRLSFKAQSEINTAVAKYLNFDWGMQAMDYSGNILLDSSDFFKSGDAYIDYSTNSPVIVLPLANAEDFKTKLYQNVNGSKKDSSTGNGTTSVHSTSANTIKPMDDSTTKETSNENYIYLVNNWNTTNYSMSRIITSSSSADTDETNAYIDRIDATKAENLYFDYDSTKTDGTFTKLKYTGFVNDANGDSTIENKLANIVCAEFNSTKLDYTVTLINKDYINQSTNNTSPFIENLIYHGNQYGSYKSIVFSTLLISVLVAFIIVSLFLILNYGLSALTTIGLTPAILLITLAIFNSFGAEFNIGTVIALIGIAIVSLFSALPYFKGIKEELYKGKNLKKANEEISKKTAGIQIDLSVVTIILGLVAYLIPNTIMTSIGATLILGGLFNLVMNGLVLRLLYYYLTNSSFIAEHLNLLMIEKKKIPDLSKDEKPTYFDGFKKKEKKNTARTFSIIAGVLLLASIIGLATFQMASGSIYNTSSSTTSSRVYIQFEYNENSDIKSVSDLETKVLNNLYTYDQKSSSTTKTKVAYNDVLNYTYSYKKNYLANKETLKKVYFIVELKDYYSADSTVSAYVDSTYKLENATIEDALKYLIVTYNSSSNFTDVSLKDVTNVNADTNNYYCLLFASIGCAIVSVYFIIRFGISRGLVSLVLVGGAATITTGIFSLTRGTFSSQITLAVVLLVIIGYAILENYFMYERNIRKDDRIDKKDLIASKDSSQYALNVAYSNIVIMVVLSAFIIISFLFASTFTTYFIIYALVGIAFMLVFYKALVVNYTYFLSGFFNNIGHRIGESYDERRKAKEAKKHVVDKGDGPEEATFIGIND